MGLRSFSTLIFVMINKFLEFNDYKQLKFSIHPSLYAKDYIGYITTLLEEDTIIRLDEVEKGYYRIYSLNSTLEFMCCIYLKYNDEKIWIPRIDTQNLKLDDMCYSIDLKTYNLPSSSWVENIDECDKLLSMIAFILNEIYPLKSICARTEIQNILRKCKDYDQTS